MRRRSVTTCVLALSAAAAYAQPGTTRYCSDLQKIVQLAGSVDKFASITGEPRDGNFHATSLALPGWSDCAIYAQHTYSCDSDPIGSAQEAQTRLSTAVAQVKACFPENSWEQNAERSSLFYVVLHHAAGLANITISTDEESKERHFVRFILFPRR
jgi:hypothetical protein